MSHQDARDIYVSVVGRRFGGSRGAPGKNKQREREQPAHRSHVRDLLVPILDARPESLGHRTSCPSAPCCVTEEEVVRPLGKVSGTRHRARRQDEAGTACPPQQGTRCFASSWSGSGAGNAFWEALQSASLDDPGGPWRRALKVASTFVQALLEFVVNRVGFGRRFVAVQ